MTRRKLTPEQEAEIVAAVKLRRTLTNKALQARYGVSHATIQGCVERAMRAGAVRAPEPRDVWRARGLM